MSTHVVVLVYNPSPQEVASGGIGIEGNLRLHGEFEASLELADMSQKEIKLQCFMKLYFAIISLCHPDYASFSVLES